MEPVTDSVDCPGCGVGVTADGKAWTAPQAVRGVPGDGLRLEGLSTMRRTAARETKQAEAVLRRALREHGVGYGESRRAQGSGTGSGDRASVVALHQNRRQRHRAVASVGRAECVWVLRSHLESVGTCVPTGGASVNVASNRIRPLV